MLHGTLASSGGPDPADRAFRRRRENKSRRRALRKRNQPSALLFLASAMAAVGADGAAAATGGVSYPARISTGALPDGAAEPRFCEHEAAACAVDPECRGCSAIVMGWGEGENAELAGCGGGGVGGNGGGGGGGRGAGCRGGHFFGAGPRKEEEEEDEGGLIAARRTKSCLGNRTVAALLACRVRSAGCERSDAPYVMLDKQRAGGMSSSAERSSAKGDARPAPRLPAHQDEERAGRARGVPAAGAVDVKADAEGLDPMATTRRAQIIFPGGLTCNGILNDGICCSEACGVCESSGCSSKGNGSAECCPEDILLGGVRCADNDREPPCIVFGKERPTTVILYAHCFSPRLPQNQMLCFCFRQGDL